MMDTDTGLIPGGEAEDIYTVTEITEAIRHNLETEFPSVSVIGEIANFKAHTSGHFYFSLRDDDNMIRVVVFRRYTAGIGFGPDNGVSVIARGRLSHYGGSGQTQLLAASLEPAGQGRAELDFRRLLQKLAEEGLTSAQRKRDLPPYPDKIAVLTSPTGAVIEDIIDTLARRWPVARIVHICTDVQGAAAADSITRGLAEASAMEDVDLVILARGGGSAEDLWTFNDEEVARAVAGCSHPIITGIGHEIDTTICDYVADLRAATPTAAAELAVPDIGEVVQLIDESLSRMRRSYAESAARRLNLIEYMLRSSVFPAIAHGIDRMTFKVDDMVDRLDLSLREAMRSMASVIPEMISKIRLEALSGQRRSESGLSGMKGRLAALNPSAEISRMNGSVQGLTGRLHSTLASLLERRAGEVESGIRTLDGLYPLAVLKRGYTYCTSETGDNVLGSVDEVGRGERICVNFHDGGAVCRVEDKRKGKKWRGR